MIIGHKPLAKIFSFYRNGVKRRKRKKRSRIITLCWDQWTNLTNEVIFHRPQSNLMDHFWILHLIFFYAAEKRQRKNKKNKKKIISQPYQLHLTGIFKSFKMHAFIHFQYTNKFLLSVKAGHFFSFSLCSYTNISIDLWYWVSCEKHKQKIWTFMRQKTMIGKTNFKAQTNNERKSKLFN